MPELNFKMSDDQKYRAIWTLLNSEYNEEGNWVQTYSISAVYDDYALAFNYETGEYVRAYYVKDDESDSLTITETVKCYVMDITEKEKATLDTLRELNGNTYELVSETLQSAEENLNKIEEFSSKIEELNESISTLNQEKKTVEDQYTEASTQITSLTEELDSLKEYKYSVEKQQKEAIIAEYAEQLSEEVLSAFSEKLDDYSVLELDKELAYTLRKTNPTVYTKTPQYFPKDEPKSGIEEILDRFK